MWPGPVHVISWSPAGGSSAQAPRQGRELIISHPAGVLGSEDAGGGSQSCLPATLPADPQGFSFKLPPSRDPTCPLDGAPATAGSAWETRIPQTALHSGRLLGRAACNGSPFPTGTLQRLRVVSLPLRSGLWEHRQALEGAQGLPSALSSPHPTGAIDISASPVKRGPQPSIHWFWEWAPFSREEHWAGSPETRSQESGLRKQVSGNPRFWLGLMKVGSACQPPPLSPACSLPLGALTSPRARFLQWGSWRDCCRGTSCRLLGHRRTTGERPGQTGGGQMALESSRSA